MHWEDKGAFTGEVSATMLLTLGCRFVILGHSERRSYFFETDEFVARKARAAIRSGLIPIVCVGETLEERQSGKMDDVLTRQVTEGLAGLSEADFERAAIAYEPVWAIGTGVTATPEQAEEAHAFVRGLVQAQFGGNVSARVRIQYGGSVKADNAAELMAKPNVDGALVGGASLKAASFAAIVKAAV
jgi:triosephosphate isomerase